MHPRPALVLLVRPHLISRLFGIGLGLALLLVLDGYLLVLASRSVGIYLLVAATASTGLIGAIGIFTAYRRELGTLLVTVKRGAYPHREIVRILALLVAASLLIIPGAATDLLGLAIAIRPVGWIVGVFLERQLRPKLELLYQYLRLEE